MILLHLLTSLASAQATCDYTSLHEAIEGLKAPGVIVLGERKGTPLDLNRAARLVSALRRNSTPVTVALEAVDASQQPALDDLMKGQVTLDTLDDRLKLHDTWGFSYDAYRPLFEAGANGAHLVAAGLPFELKPEDEIVPLPAGYYFQLSGTMGEATLPVAFEETFTTAMAWRGFSIARSAMNGWDHKGWLVIVADRALVEGGLGVGWQAQRLSDVPVKAVVLANAQSPCVAGDEVWKNLFGQ
jgi:hypothetical protein